MTDSTTPDDAVASPVPAPAASSAPPPGYPAPGSPYAPVAGRRPLWPWILGGSILLLILIVVGAVVAITVFLNAGAGAKKAVLDYDLAYKTVDCDLLEATLTPDFEAAYFGDPFDCAAWKEGASQLTVDGRYGYSVLIVSARESGDTAQVIAVETDVTTSEPSVYNLAYSLVREGGHWLIDDIEDSGQQ